MANAPANKPAKGIVRDLVTEVVRIAFPHIKSPNTGGQFPSNKYEVHALIPKTDEKTLGLLRKAALEAGGQVWPGITAANLIVGIRDGDEKANLDGFPGCFFICAKSKKPVPVYGPAREVLAADAVGGGDYCRLCVTAGAYKRNLEPMIARDLIQAGRKVGREKDETGKESFYLPAVTFYLNSIQLVRRGESFGGGGGSPTVFPVEDGGMPGNTSDGAPIPPGQPGGGEWG